MALTGHRRLVYGVGSQQTSTSWIYFKGNRGSDHRLDNTWLSWHHVSFTFGLILDKPYVQPHVSKAGAIAALA